ncbi:MAG TPA: hypothetical protein VGO80_11820 [Solirubrobacteraceae bacterium]|nr:hypothetical protein [Solirubrobacteraceae bacterium]
MRTHFGSDYRCGGLDCSLYVHTCQQNNPMEPSMTAAAFLTDKQAEIEARAAQLEEEARQLRAASAALGQLQSDPAGAPIARRPARRKQAASPARRTTGPGAATRAQEALSLIAATPGITVPQLADKMSIKKNYLYRVVPGLEEAGAVRRVGEHGWALADAPADTPDASAVGAATDGNA